MEHHYYEPITNLEIWPEWQFKPLDLKHRTLNIQHPTSNAKKVRSL